MLKTQQLPVLSHKKKQLIRTLITVKISENVLSKRKTIPIEVNLLWEKISLRIQLV